MLNSDYRSSAISNFDYYESVLHDKVPTMTSNTTPEGVVFASKVLKSNYDAYRAFDRYNEIDWILETQEGCKRNGRQEKFTDV